MLEFIGLIMLFAIITKSMGSGNLPAARPPRPVYVPKSKFRIEHQLLAHFREWRSKIKLPSLSGAVSGVRRRLGKVGDQIKSALVKWWDKK